MALGYLYVLRNKAFADNVVKIGKTGRSPDVRAREIYDGATGVPLPFDVALTCSVADMKYAENLVHKRLSPYRLNRRREFFVVPLHVADKIVCEVCVRVNSSLGFSCPDVLRFEGDSDDAGSKDHSVGVFKVDPRRLLSRPAGTSTLTQDQVERVELFYSIAGEFFPDSLSAMLDGFSRDVNPEREIEVWEGMAKALMTLGLVDDISAGYRVEAFSLLLMRTMRRTVDVLDDFKLKYFNRASAKRLLEAYELKPRPIRVDRGSGMRRV